MMDAVTKIYLIFESLSLTKRNARQKRLKVEAKRMKTRRNLKKKKKKR